MTSSPGEDAACWICLESAPDDDGKPLMRGCSCRGDTAGWAHVSCLAGYAVRKSDKAYTTHIEYANSDAELGPEAFRNEIRAPWTDCNVCKQKFIGDILREMACSWRDATKHLPESDARRIVCTIEHAQVMISAVIDLDPVVEELQNALAVVQSGNMEPMALALFFEGGIYQRLMKILALQSDWERSLFYAKELYEFGSKGNLSEARLDMVKETIKALSGEGRDHEYCTSAMLVCFENSLRGKGKEHPDTIDSACQYAHSLNDQGKTTEATKLAEEYAPLAKRVFGTDHPVTRKIEGFLIDDMLRDIPDQMYQNVTYKAKLTGYNEPSLQGRNVDVARHLQGQDDKYMVYLGSQDGSAKPMKLKVHASNLIFSNGTPVTIQNMVSARHLNGKAGTVVSFLDNKGCYKIKLYDGDTTSEIEKGNVRIDFRFLVR